MRIFLVIIFMSYFIICKSQVKITGLIRDIKSNEPVENCNIQLRLKKISKIEQFIRTDINGKFELDLREYKNFELFITHINFQDTIIEISSNVHFSIYLKPRENSLDEIIIKSEVKEIQQKKDTIVYDVKSFENKSDRNIIDIIKKLPGIIVENTGAITYNGKVINKFYVEGLDLVNGKYGIIANNLPVENVKQIQILEKHQPIKLLDSFVTSNQAALNIVLDKTKRNKFFGQIKVGMGLCPLLYDNSLFALKISKKISNVTLYKGNNIGVSISNETNNLYSSTFKDIFESKNNINYSLDIITPPSPIIGQNKFNNLSNNLFTSNFILETKNKNLIKLNLLLNNEIQKYSTLQNTKIINPIDTSVIEESNQVLEKLKNLDIIFEINKNKQDLYLINQLQLNLKLIEKIGNIYNSNTIQNVKIPFGSVINEIKKMKKYGNKIYSFRNFTSFAKTQQKLELNKGVFISNINNNISFLNTEQINKNTTFYSKSECGFITKIKLVKINNTLGIKYINENNSTTIERFGGFIVYQVDSLKNKITSNNISPYLVSNIDFDINKFNVNLNLESGMSNYKISSLLNNNSLGINKFIFQPRLTITHMLSKHINSYLNLSLNNITFGSMEELNIAKQIINYRKLITQSQILPLQISNLYNLSFDFKKVISSLFSTLNFGLNQTKNNLQYEYTYTNELENKVAIIRDNYTNKIFSNYYIGHSFNKIKANLSFKYNIEFGKRDININSKQGIIKSISQKFDLKIIKELPNFVVENNSSILIFKNKSTYIGGISNTNFNELFQNDLKINYNYKEKLEIEASILTILNTSKQLTNNLSKGVSLIDLSINYKIKSKNEFVFSVYNLANQIKYSELIKFENYEYSTNYFLRQRQFVLKYLFNF